MLIEGFPRETLQHEVMVQADRSLNHRASRIRSSRCSRHLSFWNGASETIHRGYTGPLAPYAHAYIYSARLYHSYHQDYGYLQIKMVSSIAAGRSFDTSWMFVVSLKVQQRERQLPGLYRACRRKHCWCSDSEFAYRKLRILKKQWSTCH